MVEDFEKLIYNRPIKPNGETLWITENGSETPNTV